jgi:SNW domain-containing protein 1
MSLSSLLPKPKLSTSKWAIEEETIKKPKKNSVPAYGKRSDFVPQEVKDFGDGGAFPEINIIQYPLGMGRQKTMGSDLSETIPLQTDRDGKIRYDLVLQQKEDSKKIYHTSLKDMTEQDMDGFSTLAGPEVISEVTEKTKIALEKMLDGKS